MDFVISCLSKTFHELVGRFYADDNTKGSVGQDDICDIEECHFWGGESKAAEQANRRFVGSGGINSNKCFQFFSP